MGKKIYIGIDPGGKGCLSYPLDGKWVKASCVDMNDLAVNDMILTHIERLKDAGHEVVVTIEDVHALGGVGAGSTFSFAYMTGIQNASVMGCKVRFERVPPKVWQKEIWIPSDIVKKPSSGLGKNGKPKPPTTDTKKTSLNAAKRLFPGVDFRRNDRCKVDDDNVVDSILISEYARRKNF